MVTSHFGLDAATIKSIQAKKIEFAWGPENNTKDIRCARTSVAELHPADLLKQLKK
jgi:hypothetical protein